MKTYKPNETEIVTLRDAAKSLATGNKMLSDGKKSSDAGKAGIAAWLVSARGCHIDTLPLGEIVHVEGVAMVEIASQSRFDEKAFALAHPDLHATFIRPLRITKYKPLV